MLALFNLFSWVTSVAWKILDLCPPFIRRPVFKLILREYGSRSVIDYGTYIRYPSQIVIGCDTTINRGCKFFSSYHFRNVRIEIGDHVAVAPEVCFLAAGHDHTERTLPDTAASIRVGDYAWIGARSTILQGVTIGEGAVIAAGSVVTHDVQPYTIVAGVPARMIKQRKIKGAVE